MNIVYTYINLVHQDMKRFHPLLFESKHSLSIHKKMLLSSKISNKNEVILFSTTDVEMSDKALKSE